MSPEEKIKRAVSSGNVSHAYIFEGSRASNKERAAEEFLALLTGSDNLRACPDYYEVKAEQGQGRSTRSVKDADMEELQSRLKMKPAGVRNVALIRDADSMTVRAQNRFLKTLEEPVPGTVMVLLSENTENLLETIRSRCVIYRFYDRETDRRKGENFDEVIGLILNGAMFYRIKKSLAASVKSREDAYYFLDILELRLRDIMVGKDSSRLITRKDAIRHIETVEETRRALNGNAITAYALKRMALRIQEN